MRTACSFVFFLLVLGACSSKDVKETKDESQKPESQETASHTATTETQENAEPGDQAKSDNADGEDSKGEDGKEKNKDAKDGKKIAKPEKPEEPFREPGSLWSESSRWNTLFNMQSRRRVGDRLFISMSEKLREAITKKLAESFPEDKDATPVIESARLSGTIREIGKDGAYKIESEPSIFFAKQERDVKIEGVIREQELAADDSVAANNIAELKISVRVPEKKDESDDKSEQKEEKPVDSPAKTGKQVEAERSEGRKETKRKAVAEFDEMKKNRQAVKTPTEEKSGAENENKKN